MSRWHTTEFDLLPERAFQPRGGRGKFSSGMTLEGGGKGGGAPAPDPRMGQAALQQIALNREIFADYRANDRPWMQGIANEALGLSRDSAALARDQFGFSRGVADRQLAQAQSQIDRSNALSDYQLENMRFNDQRYRNVGIPFEDQLLNDVRRFDSDAFKQRMVDSALADVGGAFDRRGLQASRAAGRMGIDRAIRATNDVGLERAKAEASAANMTRQAAEQVGLSTKMQMYGGMRGLAGLGATNAQLATGAMGVGAGALNAGVGAMGIGNSALGAMGSAAGGMMGAGTGFLGANNAAQGVMNSGVSSGIQGLGQFNQLQQNAANINMQNDPLNTILGAAAGVGTSWALGRSDRRLKADITHVGVDEATGLNLYEFKYIDGTKRFRGVMADEVEARYPQAVVTMPDGYKAVNYALLGIEMVEVAGETT